jgi:hypothetical protein
MVGRGASPDAPLTWLDRWFSKPPPVANVRLLRASAVPGHTVSGIGTQMHLRRACTPLEGQLLEAQPLPLALTCPCVWCAACRGQDLLRE